MYTLQLSNELDGSPDYLASNHIINNEWWTGKYKRGSGRGLIWCMIPYLG